MTPKMNRRWQPCGLLVGALLLPASLAAAQDPPPGEYDLVDLGQINFATNAPEPLGVRINDVTRPGLDQAYELSPIQVVNVTSPQGQYSAYRVVDGQAVPLGTLGGAQAAVFGVNHFGVAPGWNTRLVGLSTIGNNIFHAFNWDQATGMTDLGTLGGNESGALAINDARQVVGWAEDLQGEIHAALWEGIVAPCDLGALSGAVGTSCANDIDNFGHIVGRSFASGSLQAIAWMRDDTGAVIDYDLVAPNGGESEAFAVDVKRTDGGMVPSWFVAAGWAQVAPGGARHAAFWEVDTITGAVAPMWLGTLGGATSSALDVTHVSEGIAPCYVGWSDVAVLSSSRRSPGANTRSAAAGIVFTHAFIYDSSTGMRDLNDLIPSGSSFELTSADSINTSGSITGVGQLNGEWHAFRLDPVNPAQASAADSDHDGLVGINDFLKVLADWGACP